MDKSNLRLSFVPPLSFSFQVDEEKRAPMWTSAARKWKVRTFPLVSLFSFFLFLPFLVATYAANFVHASTYGFHERASPKRSNRVSSDMYDTSRAWLNYNFTVLFCYEIAISHATLDLTNKMTLYVNMWLNQMDGFTCFYVFDLVDRLLVLFFSSSIFILVISRDNV